jgi:hypothetical protein
MAVAQIILEFGDKGCKATIAELVSDKESVTRVKIVEKTDGKGKEALLKLINENLWGGKMDNAYWERIERKVDENNKLLQEIHAKVMKKPGRPVGYSPKKAKKEEGDGSPAPSP